MAEKALNSLKSNAGRLSQRLSENVAEHTRDSGLIDSFASGSGGGAGKYLENGAVVTPAGIDETKRMLSSRRENEKAEGLKRVIAMMTKNLPVTSFFPLVTALLSPSTPLQSRTLISLYITHCAATAPSLALLSINAYQKDLSDPNPIVRAGAIKTLAEMGLSDIRSLVGVAVTKGARDGSWYVRRAAADAVRALWRADPTDDNRTALLPTLVILLNSATALTVGSALIAWEEMCCDEWELLHASYRRWCRMLLEVDEWGQCVLLRVLLRYGRMFFLDPESGNLDADAELVLKATAVLLNHINPAVVSAAIKLYYYLAPSSRQGKIVQPLLRLLHSPAEIQALVLADCVIVAKERPHLLADHTTEFFVRFDEPSETKLLRLEILTALSNESNIRMLLKEFLGYVKDTNDAFSAQAIAALGVCAERVPGVAEECLKSLIKLSQSKNEIIITQSILVLRSLIRSPHFPATVSRSALVTRLVGLLEAGKIQAPSARAEVYWLVGQYAPMGLLETVGPDVVRVGAKGFVNEADPAKLQLLTLSAKLLVLSHLSPLTPYLRELSLLFTYLTTLARYDATYEVRDRARFLRGLLSSAGVGVMTEGARVELEEEDFRRGVAAEEQGGTVPQAQGGLTAQQVRKILFDGKNTLCEDTDETTGEELGLFSVRGKRSLDSVRLPPFPVTVPPSSIRDAATDSLRPPSLANSNQNSRSTTPTSNLRGFGSDSMGNTSRGGPVVLVPTHFADGGQDREEMERNFSGTTSAAAGRKNGFVDLDDFYADERRGRSGLAEEEDSEEESEDDEEDEEEGDEDDSGSGETGSEGGTESETEVLTTEKPIA